MKTAALDLPQTLEAFHHAYLIEGDPHSTRDAIQRELAERYAYPTAGNSDFWDGLYETLSIDEARTIKEAAISKPVLYDVRIFVIAAGVIPVDAQNALLKLFEEPPAQTRFFLVVSRVETLLPTLKSRLQSLKGGVGSVGDTEVACDAAAFTAAAPAERLKMVQKITKDRDKSSAFVLLTDLEGIYKKDLRENAERRMALETIWEAKDYLNDSSSSVKMLMEHVCVTIPRL